MTIFLTPKIILTVVLNSLYLTASILWYKWTEESVFGTPHHIFWMPLVAGILACRVVFPDALASYRHALSGAITYCVISAGGGALLWVGHALVASGFSVMIFDPFSMFPAFMMGVDGVRNMLVMVPVFIVLAWAWKKLDN